jgi:hypothetical protein
MKPPQRTTTPYPVLDGADTGSLHEPDSRTFTTG